MSDNPQPEETLLEEFRKLGTNLISAVQTAWDKPEVKKLQDEVVNGLNELGSTLGKEADKIISGPTGQQIKTGVEQVGDRLRNVETQEKVRQELLNALKTANNELQKVIERWSDKGSQPQASGEGASDEQSPPDQNPGD